MDYYVLKGREMREPVPESKLQEELDSGNLTPDDLIRPANGLFWSPLRKVFSASGAGRKSILDIPTDAPIEAPLPADDWLDRPLRIGGICLGFGALVLLLSPWPLLLYGPLLAAAFAAGVMAMFKRRVGAGIGLCIGAILVPAIFNWFAAIVGPVEPPPGNPAVMATPPAMTDLADNASGSSGTPQIAIAKPVDDGPTPTPPATPEAASSNETPAPAATPMPEKRTGVALPRPISPAPPLPEPSSGKEKNK